MLAAPTPKPSTKPSVTAKAKYLKAVKQRPAPQPPTSTTSSPYAKPLIPSATPSASPLTPMVSAQEPIQDAKPEVVFKSKPPTTYAAVKPP
jgi:hypothetical protein